MAPRLEQIITSVDEYVEKLKPSCDLGGNVKCM